MLKILPKDGTNPDFCYICCSSAAFCLSWATLGRSWGALGLRLAALGHSWAPLGRSWPLLGRSWPLLGRPWGALGCSRPLLGHSWAALKTMCKNHQKIDAKNDRFGLPKGSQNETKIAPKSNQKLMQKTKRKKNRHKTVLGLSWEDVGSFSVAPWGQKYCFLIGLCRFS